MALTYRAFYPSFYHIFSCHVLGITPIPNIAPIVQMHYQQIALLCDFMEVSHTQSDEQVAAGPVRFFRMSQSRPEVTDIVTTVLTELLPGWREQPSDAPDGWNLMWTWSVPKLRYDALLSFQRINHYPNSRHITRKDNLKRSIMRYRAMGARSWEFFDILPETYVMPSEFLAFCEAFRKYAASSATTLRNYWIVKPVGLSRGRGIEVISDLSELSYSDPVVVQRYIERPLLLNGYKFDLRLYVCVTSFSPLEAFIYTQGFARFSTSPYSLNSKDRMVHLTNSSVQSKSHDQVTFTSSDAEQGGTKLALSYLWQLLARQRPDFDAGATWQSIVQVVVKSLFCGEHDITQHPNAFELYGFDVLIDEDLRPWLIEVNSSPSLAISNELDRAVKSELIKDTIRLVDPLPCDYRALKSILARRMSSRGASSNHSPQQAQVDLAATFCGHQPRPYGAMPAQMGFYERIAPSKFYDLLCKGRRKRSTGR